MYKINIINIVIDNDKINVVSNNHIAYATEKDLHRSRCKRMT